MKNQTAVFSIGCFLFVTLLLLAFSAYTVALYYCWNLLISPVFDITTITIEQAALGSVLLTLLSGTMNRK